MNKYEADEILNLAIMSKTPCFIVEGVDDVWIYESVAESAGVACEIYSVEMIDGLSGGNDGVIQAMTALEALPMPPGRQVEHYVMGVIDRDARYYRNEIPALPSILCLRYYSIESHFVSEHAVRPSIDKLTRISSSDMIDTASIFTRVTGRMQDAYYFSLEALKKAVTPGYSSIVGFSSNIGRRKDESTISSLQARTADLDAFARSINISSNIDSMREFVKGKWLLIAFSEELFLEIEQLVVRCKSIAITQCRMCKLDNAAPCLYQMKGGLNKNSLYSILQEFVESPEFDYIRDSMRAVAATAAV